MLPDLAPNPGASPTPAPTEPPKPANPEPMHPPRDPDTSHVDEHEPGRSEHPGQ